MVDTLGIGFSYEEIFEMCQKVSKMETPQRTRSAMSRMSTLSGDRGHIVDVESPRQDGGFLDTGVDLEKMGKRLRFRKYVSEQSEQSAQSLDEGKVLMDKTHPFNIKIIGGIKLGKY